MCQDRSFQPNSYHSVRILNIIASYHILIQIKWFIANFTYLCKDTIIYEIYIMNYQLRAWKQEDAPSLALHINNINIWNNIRDGLPHPYTEEDAATFIKMNIEHKGLQENFAIEINGEAVGGIGFIIGNDVERISAEIGYWLSEQYWGCGIMTSVVKEAVKYAFENLPVIRIYAGVFEYNIPSMRVLEKAGFTKEAILRKAAIKNGKIIDLHYYALIKEEK